jgi:acyl carrier protein
LPAPLNELIASIMEVDASEVTDESDNESLGKWDSLRTIMLATTLESEYGLTLTTDDLEQLHSVASIRRILRGHGIEHA